jgi:hypothetical protein
MKLKGILLPKQSKTRDETKTGNVMTLHPTTRFYSDGFEIKCFNW